MADRIKALFLEALDTPTEQRLAYLDSACGGDAEARRRVEALLRAHEASDRLLDRPAWCPTPEQEGPLAFPVAGLASPFAHAERAGRVQLLGEIARGGMGAVLRGHDPELGRELAVKVILPAHRDNPDLLHRFVGEARLSGQLQHPGIVPVYDLGQLADGRPFFAMKLIQGRTLAQLLAERADPSHDLPRFLRYFEAVCQAVGYAHSRGVIHRDLKPANVMVGAFGEVQVMDWGLAKRLEEGPEAGLEQAPPPPASLSSTTLPAALTRPGAVVGTPEYLAPEQARGQAGDQRADVFGLGAILCEILTGAAPFRQVGLFQLLRQARAGDLSDATDRLDRCGADPELVRLAKACLMVESGGRPADGGAVAAWLAKYLANVQERLRRAEVGQARAEARAEGERIRRRLVVGLAAAVLSVVALGGGTLLLAQRYHAEQASEQAQRQLAAEAALARAADLQQQDRWHEALTVLEQARHRLDERDGQVNREVRRAVDALELVGRLETIRLRTATWTGRSFAWARADHEYESEFRGARLGSPDDPAEVVAERVRASGVRAALVAALDAWAVSSPDREHRDWARAVARSADQDGDWGQRLRASWADPAVLTQLAREAPIDRLSPHLVQALAEALGKDPEAVRLLRKAQLQHPGDFWLNLLLANRLSDERRHAESVEFYRAALAARPGTSAVLINLGLALKNQNKLDEACDCYRQAIVNDPGSAFAYTNLGTELRRLNRLAEAITCWRKAIELDPKLGMAHANLGVGLLEKGQVDEALASCGKAIELDPMYALAHYNLGNALRSKGRIGEALACYRRAVALDPMDARIQTNLGVVLGARNQVDEAIGCYRKAIELDPTLLEPHSNLGIILMAQNRLDEAITHLRKAVELGPKDAENHYDLGTAWVAANESDKAIECFRKASELDPSHARAYCYLGHALQSRGDFAKALVSFRRGHELGSKRSNWKSDSGAWVRDCEQLIEREKQLLGVLEGSSEPGDARKRIEWARLCVQTRRYVAAVRLSSEAFGVEEKLTNDLAAGHRYRAATAAALAGVGQGRDADQLTNEARATLRGQALDWLKADLAGWRGHSDKNERVQALRSWRADTALSGVRDQEELAKLSQTERAAWGELWAEVESLLAR